MRGAGTIQLCTCGHPLSEHLAADDPTRQGAFGEPLRVHLCPGQAVREFTPADARKADIAAVQHLLAEVTADKTPAVADFAALARLLLNLHGAYQYPKPAPFEPAEWPKERP